MRWFRVPQAVKDLSQLLPHLQEFCIFCELQNGDNKTCLHTIQILKTVFPKISYLQGFSKKDGEKLGTELCSDRQMASK